MEITRVTPYQERGLLRHRIEWTDGEVKGVADSRCALTGVSLGSNWTLCVRHCRIHGHFSADVNHLIGLFILGVIPREKLQTFILSTTIYPDDAPERERVHLEGF